MSTPSKPWDALEKGLLFILAVITAVLAIMIVMSGCTIAAGPVVSKTPSYDGSNLNSGFLGFNSNHVGQITWKARDRYNGLIEIYGTNFIPALKKDYEITPVPGNTNAFWISKEGLEKFEVLTSYRDSAIK